MVPFSRALMALAATLPLALAANNTVDIPALKTWWHASGEINTQTPVAATNVRQSHLYNVQIATAANTTDFYDSFVYESIPRSGKGPVDDDGITIESSIGATMAWSQFLYAADATVKISRRDGVAVKRENVIIRPTNLGLGFTIQSVDDDTAITLLAPFRPDSHGLRFSIEIQDDVWEYRNAGPGGDSHYVQNATADGESYVAEYTSDMPIVGREPRNALLVFASPFPDADMVPSTDSAEVYSVKPGKVTGLDTITNEIVSFGPGVYSFSATAHAVLAPSVRWVHLAPGAYVKGALEYTNTAAATLQTTGQGVLSGEEYVYLANPAAGYNSAPSSASSLTMFRGANTTTPQRWVLAGPTMANPPAAAIAFPAATVDVAEYKQLGAWHSHTTALELYPGSLVRDVFLHASDDALRTYHSDVHAERVCVWQTHSGAPVQLGWAPRDVGNVTLVRVDVIHSRYSAQLDYEPRALIASAATALGTADTAMTIANYTITGFRGEGIQPALLGMNLLANIDGFTVENIFIAEWHPNATGMAVSKVRGFEDKQGEKVGMKDFLIKTFIVGTGRATFEADNWGVGRLGELEFEDAYWGDWRLEY
ncbi:glycoside hydrolase [Geopyxis carbonaria]|nr:glycoside hydrolase [Geopyxis carbonaria]